MTNRERPYSVRENSELEFDGYLVTSENFESIFVKNASQLIHLHNGLSQAFGVDLENVVVHRVRIEIIERGAET